jgi:hypothetical protein
MVHLPTHTREFLTYQLISINIQIANFTLEEKVNVTTGIGLFKGRCVGNIAALEPVDGRGWPGLCLEVKKH